MRALDFLFVEPLLPLFLVHVAHEGHILLDVSDVLGLLCVLVGMPFVNFLAEVFPSRLAIEVGLLEDVLQQLLLFLLLALNCHLSELSAGQTIDLRRF